VQAAAALDALYKKSIWLKWIQDKNHHADAAQDDGAKRAFNIFTIHLNDLRF
jgi:hypothetical protein